MIILSQQRASRRDALKVAGAVLTPLTAYAQPARITEIITVRCGELEFLFDPTLGFVRHIRWNGIEVLNGIYAAVRDESWGTVPPAVANVIVETEADAFKISFEVSCKQAGIDFFWTGSINGAPRALDFQMEGEARSTFKRNRIGFCVLHPLRECAGKACKLDKQGGGSEDGVFPLEISPHQPFKDLRGMRHEVYPGLTAELRFTGDTFETEDHRNWTDGNFKTYCTPLSLPFPVEVKQGTKIIQSVQLRLAGTPKPLPAAWKKPLETVIRYPAEPKFVKAPKVGFGLPPEGAGLTAYYGSRLLRQAGVSHLRADLTPGAVDSVLDRAAASLGLLPSAGLEAAVFVNAASAESELAAAAKGVAARGLPVARWMVFCVDEPSTSRKWVDLARRYLKGAPVGAGTNQFFTELNRGRPEASALDFIAYSINPQVHAFDNMSLMENLAPQADTVRTASGFAAGKPLVVSPVTLRPRTNASARVDPRQGSLFAAAWTLGSLRYLVGVSSVTYYETHGAAGVLDKGGVFPLYHVFASVAGWPEWMPLASSDESAVVAIAARKPPAGLRVLVANLTDSVQRIRLAGLPGHAARVRILDEETLREAMERPEAFRAGSDWEMRGPRKELSLLPYAVAVLWA